MAELARIGVTETELRFKLDTGELFAYNGTLTGNTHSETHTILGVDGDQLYYSDHVGDERVCPASVGPSVSGPTGRLWVYDNTIRYIDENGNKTAAHTDSYSDQYGDHADDYTDSYDDVHGDHADDYYDAYSDYADSHSDSYNDADFSEGHADDYSDSHTDAFDPGHSDYSDTYGDHADDYSDGYSDQYGDHADSYSDSPQQVTA